MSAECAFCHGQPVGDARSWVSDQGRHVAPCPRCGDITLPDGHVITYREQLDALSRAALTPAPKDGPAT